MLPWSPPFFIIMVILVLLYALFSVYLKRATGLFIATTFHIVLGVLSLPSIGWYVIALAIIECFVGIMIIVKRRQHQQ
ncbi:MAG TPA: hypothetical protein VK079_03730 [Bacillota bacterium]|nr:hypothetical protein [Bacillota bacterium]